MSILKKENLNYFAQTGSKIVLIAGGYIVFGAITYHFLEKMTWVDAFYFVVITLATIGYGDIAPKTNGGKIFTIFYIIIGLAIFSTLVTNIVQRARARREKKLIGSKTIK